MIQDIYPSKLDNVYKNRTPEPDDLILVFDDEGKVFADIRELEPKFLTASQMRTESPVYLFSIDDRGYFLAPQGS